MIIDFKKAKEASKHKEIEFKIKSYEMKLTEILEKVDEILDDIGESDINWFEGTIEQREKLEAISTFGLMAETYAGWAKE